MTNHEQINQLSEIEELLLSHNPDNTKENTKSKPQITPTPAEILITQNAREKAIQLGPIVANIGRGAYEWYGFVVGDSQHRVRDVVLAKDQDVSGAHASVDGSKIAMATAEVRELNARNNTDYQILGWIHNHADFSTFHSGTDDNNIKQVLNSVSLNNLVSVQNDLKLIESTPSKELLEDRVLITGKESTDGAIEYILNNERALNELLKKYNINPNGKDPKKLAIELFGDVLGIAEFRVKEPKLVGFCYSIVVNNRGDEPYTEIAILEENAITGKKKMYIKESAPLTIAHVEDDIQFTPNELRAEIKRKIRFPQPFYKRVLGFGRSRFGSKWGRREERNAHDYQSNNNLNGYYSSYYSSPYQSSANSNIDLNNANDIQAENSRINTGDDNKFIEAESTMPESQSGIIKKSTSQKNNKLQRKNNSKKIDIAPEKLAELFTKKILGYTFGSEVAGDYNNTKYSQFMNNVISKILADGSGFADAFKKTGFLTENSPTAEEPNIDESILEAVTKRIYTELKEGNKNIIQLAREFLEDEKGGRYNDAIQKYNLTINKINPDVAGFSEAITKYSEEAGYRYGENIKYRDWIREVISNYLSSETQTIEEAILRAGEPKTNQQIMSYKLLISNDKVNLAKKICNGKYEQATMDFMKGFSNPKTRHEAIESYYNIIKENKETIKEKHSEKGQDSDIERLYLPMR